ncbi:MAG: 3-deoxy-D-manno-octulosonic acid transferase [Acidiferrobacterales bacterium]
MPTSVTDPLGALTAHHRLRLSPPQRKTTLIEAVCAVSSIHAARKLTTNLHTIPKPNEIERRTPAWLAPSYTLALYLLSPAIFVHTLIQALRSRDVRYLRERFGLHQLPSLAKPIWVHAASVGEVIAAEALVLTLRERYPGQAIVVTTSTTTGGQVARQRLPSDIRQYYLPFDFPGAIKRFLRALDPGCALIMETEIWLNLYRRCATKDIPILLINGRLSPRTLNAPPWSRHVYAAALATVKVVLARSAQDAEGFIALGAWRDRVKVAGNIKFAATDHAENDTAEPLLPRPYVLAVSTHADEERRVAKLWQVRDRGRHLLVIAPRHPTRRQEILKQLEPVARRVAVRSRGDAVSNDTDVYLADTLGELRHFMTTADVVFIGGSLVPHGGHNALEPARLGRAIVFGPHMENFADEAATLLDSEAAIQVANDEALENCLTDLLRSPEARNDLGKRAEMLMRDHQDIAKRYADEIARHCALCGARSAAS